ncbi:hypothetical protein JXA12_05425 [Candidatus Woesearchaeota archaeon]|nr:hypothetical protein [Candidatus Woesearchaeota archaeon]
MLKRKTHVFLDTNVLLLPGKGIDVFTLLHRAMEEPYRLCTYEGVIKELETIMKGEKKQSFDAKLGYILAKQKALKTLASSSGAHIDDVFVAKTGTRDIVATQDKELTKRLKEKGVRVLRYQQQKFIFA